MRKNLRELIKAIDPLGWKVTGQNGQQHYILENADGSRRHTQSLTSSDARSIKNLVSQIKRIDSGFYDR